MDPVRFDVRMTTLSVPVPDFEDGRSSDPILLEIEERFVRMLERVRHGVRHERDLDGEPQQGIAIGTRVGRDALQRPLLEEVALVVERWDLREMDARDSQGRTAIEHGERSRHEFASRREKNRRVEWMRGAIEAPSHPHGTERSCKLLVALFSAEHVDLAAAVAGNLDHEVRRAAEPEETQTRAGPRVRPRECPVADDARAQERRERASRKALGKGVHECFRRDHVLGVASVSVPSGEARRETQVLGTANAKTTASAGPVQPRDTDARAGRKPAGAGPETNHTADDLVTGHEVRTPRRQISRGDVKIRPADTTGLDPHQQFAGPRLGPGSLDEA